MPSNAVLEEIKAFLGLTVDITDSIFVAHVKTAVRRLERDGISDTSTIYVEMLSYAVGSSLIGSGAYVGTAEGLVKSEKVADVSVSYETGTRDDNYFEDKYLDLLASLISSTEHVIQC